jgi:hypothetical protein
VRKGEGEIHVTIRRKKFVRRDCIEERRMGKEGWVVNLFIRFAFYKRDVNCFLYLSQFSV